MNSSDVDNDLKDDSEPAKGLSLGMDMNEWFNADIVHFTETDRDTQDTPVDNVVRSRRSWETRKSGTKEQSAVGQMRELSERLERERSMQQQQKSLESIPIKAVVCMRKRLIDNTFNELLEPTTNINITVPSSPSKSTPTMVPLNPMPAMFIQPAKKPRLEESTAFSASLIALKLSDTLPTNVPLSNKLSSKIQSTHSHTEACNHLLSNELYDKDSAISSFYNPEPVPTPNKPILTSFFTAGPVW